MEDPLEILGKNLKANILKNDLANKVSTGKDILGIAVDLIIELPVIDTLNKIWDSLSNYNALRLHKKITKFLFGISDVPLLDRRRFIEELEDLPYLQEKSGETLLDIIERVNHLSKIDILINLFKATALEKIDISEFLRLTTTLEKVSITDIHALKNYEIENELIPGRYEGSLTDALYSAGLLSISLIGGNSGTLFKINNLGRQLIIYGLNYTNEKDHF